MSPDPLLSSGRPPDPQTWNRYVYGRDNPINLIDPSGLYTFRPTVCAALEDGGCTQDQIDEHDRQEQEFRNALSAIRNAIIGLGGGMRDGQQRLQSVLDFYGNQGERNSVTVGFDSVNDPNEPAAVATTFENRDGTIDITFDTSKFAGENVLSFGGIAAHEGTHGMDVRRPTAGSGLTRFQREYRADTSRSLFTEGYFFFVTAGEGGAMNNRLSGTLWNSSWALQDEQTMRDHAVTEFTLSRGSRYQETVPPVPHDPW